MRSLSLRVQCLLLLICASSASQGMIDSPHHELETSNTDEDKYTDSTNEDYSTSGINTRLSDTSDYLKMTLAQQYLDEDQLEQLEEISEIRRIDFKPLHKIDSSAWIDFSEKLQVLRLDLEN